MFERGYQLAELLIDQIERLISRLDDVSRPLEQLLKEKV